MEVLPLVTTVRVNPDRSVELLPRWGELVTVICTKRGRVPLVLAA